jgi:hypothetical protein
MDGGQNLARVQTPSLPAAVSRPARKALLVLGMSRSGTSLLAHVLHVLGAALPNDLMGAGHGNPLGHFEPQGLVTLNNLILESLDRAWDDPRPIPPRWFRSRPAFRFLERITEQIRQSYADAPLLVIKDPRLCRLLPLYLDALDVLDIEPLAVLQVRPVAEVVQSLVDRDAMQPGLAEFLWLRSVIEAEVQSRHCRRVWVSMAGMMADWPETVRRITETLGLDWPMERYEASSEIGPLLKPRLCHSVPSDTYDATTLRFSVATWAAVEHGLAGDEPAVRDAFDTIRGALHDLDRMYEPYLSALTDMRNSLSWRLTRPLRVLRRVARFR